MKGMSLLRAAQACGGQLRGMNIDPSAELGRVVIDSRQVCPGDFFVAYRGERVDGHDYIAPAFERGAVCCLAERIPAGEDRPILLVPDVQLALEQITAAYRQTLSLPVVGITGSVGKTSAKEMIASVMEQRFRVLKTEGNLNNQIGVPMTISRIEPQHEAAVVEMGISGFGEMRVLSQIARPNIAVFTIIGHAHLEFLHDRQGVFRAKTEMLESMEEDAWVLVNGDDDLLRELQCRQRKLCFGLGENCDIRAGQIQVRADGTTDCLIEYGQRRISAHIPAFGQHMVLAALEGAAVGFVMGLTDEEIAQGIGAYQTVGRRGAVSETGRITLIDDCYNANPDSMRCSIDSLLKLPGRHVCILGDMLELGPEEGRMHREVGAYAARQGVELLLCSGALSRDLAQSAGPISRWFSSREELIAALPDLIRPGDRVLVKASRGMRFEQVSEALKRL